MLCVKLFCLNPTGNTRGAAPAAETARRGRAEKREHAGSDAQACVSFPPLSFFFGFFWFSSLRTAFAVAVHVRCN